MAATENGKKEMVVLYPSPGMGHLVSMVELGRLFLHRGLAVTIVTVDPPYNTGSSAAFISRASAANPGIAFHRLPSVDLPPNPSSHHLEALAFDLLRHSNSNLLAFLRSLSPAPRALVLDMFCIFALDVAVRAAAAMGRMHSRGKGISSSALPYKRTPPSWLKISAPDVEESICKFAKKGLAPSQIGVILRDSHGIAQVKSITGSKILRILKGHGLAPEIPEDLYHLIKKAVAIRGHLAKNRKDKDSKFRLILVESRVHRLARYYKRTKKLSPGWKYDSATASTLVA